MYSKYIYSINILKLRYKLSGKFERISFLLVFKIAAVKDGVCFSPVYFVNTVGSIF